MRGTIFDIQKFSIHDGPGIRTTVFLKGCPLTCLWCHNPESQNRFRELSFLPEKCIGCGHCFKTCPQQAHAMQDARHVLWRDRCVRCGICADGCHAGALKVIGRDVSVADVLAEVLKDRPFYEQSGGGMTLSGGEPTAQLAFTTALLRAARVEGLHTCLDTCGFAPAAHLLGLSDLVDLFLFDLKDTDPDRHRTTTGVALDPILDNLRKLDAAGNNIILRCPLIPGINTDDGHLKGIPAIANSLCHVTEITVHPYHPLGKSKLEQTGGESRLSDIGFPEDDDISRWLSVIRSGTRIPVRRN